MLKKHLSNIILVLVFLTGITLLLYPSVSDYWNVRHQTRAIASYTEAVARLDDTDYEKLWADAQAYNEALPRDDSRFRLTDSQREQYDSLLNVSGSGVMGYVEVPKINCRLPVYHGTDPAVLQIAIGHIEGTSLPVGGPGTHTVLSGHRGLPSAKLFSNLDQMEEGDQFRLHVLNETLTYEVDQILVVLPEEMDALAIEEGKDYCTLVTCTPYGVNSHRLLVRGHRVDSRREDGDGTVLEDGSSPEQTSDHGSDPQLLFPIGIPVVAATALLILFLILLRSGKKGRKEAE